MDAPDSHPLLTLATKQMRALLELKRALVVKGEAMTPRNMKAELYRVLVENEAAISQAGAEKKKMQRAPRSPAFAKMTDDEFVAHLESQPHLQGIDVRREIGKCQLHFSALNIVPSRARVVKWLNKADRILGVSGIGQTSFAAKKPSPSSEPDGWREWVRENATDPTNAEKSWASLDRSAQAYITEQLAKKKTGPRVKPEEPVAAGLALTAS